MYQLFNSMISTFILYLNHSDSDDDDDVERDGEVIVSTPTKISLPSVKNAIMQGKASLVRTMNYDTGEELDWYIGDDGDAYEKFKKYERINNVSITLVKKKEDLKPKQLSLHDSDDDEESYSSEGRKGSASLKPRLMKKNRGTSKKKIFEDDSDEDEDYDFVEDNETKKSSKKDVIMLEDSDEDEFEGDKKMKANVDESELEDDDVFDDSDGDKKMKADDDEYDVSEEEDEEENEEEQEEEKKEKKDDEEFEVDDSTKKKAGNGSKKKNDKGKNNKNKDSDDDSDDDIFGTNDETGEVANDIFQQLEDITAAVGNVMLMSVSEPLYNASGGTVHYIVVCNKTGNAFYVKAPLFVIVMTARFKKLQTPFTINDSQGVPTWVTSFKNYKVIQTPCANVNKWARRGKKNKTTDGFYFVVTLPIAKEKMIHEVLDNIKTEYFQKIFKSRSKNSAGKFALKYALSMQGDKPLDQGLYGYLLKNKGQGNAETAESVMTKEMNDQFASEISFKYDCHLDEFFIDFDIKEILVELIGANSWDDVDEDTRKLCYRDYPRKPLPNWDTIVNESY